MAPNQDDDDEVRFAPPSCTNQALQCQLLVVGGGLSGLSAAEEAMRRGVDVVLIEKSALGQDAASACSPRASLRRGAAPRRISTSVVSTPE